MQVKPVVACAVEEEPQPGNQEWGGGPVVPLRSQ
jgi:hypothetical protein